MRLREIKIENYGAIEDLYLSLGESKNDYQEPIIIVGTNGAGKTLFLSHIVDALVEMKRKKYSELLEVKNNNYFRIGQKSYIRNGKLHSISSLCFEGTNEIHKIYYTDLMTKDQSDFLANHGHKVTNANFQDEKFNNHGFFKGIQGDIGNEVDTNVLIYFPSTRYFEPSWLNQNSQPLRMIGKQNLVGQSSKNIIKENVLSDMENWIINVVMDRHLYETRVEKFLVPNVGGQPLYIDRIIYEDGRNTSLLKMLNELLTITYRLKYPNIEYARLAVSSKESRRVSLIIKEVGEVEFEIAPTFNHLSSGEAMLLSMFGMLLKEYDELNSTGTFSLEDVTGIVLIDEIDLNLHIQFAKEILPVLIGKFPKIQFILTTHSPFFLLGMEKNYNRTFKIFNLPDGHEISAEDFHEVQRAYETFLNNFTEVRQEYLALQERLSIITKPLLITEGKTDWKHLKGALDRFKSNGEFNELEVEFLEYEEEFNLSDSQLNTMLNELRKVHHGKKIIGIFDSDEGNGKKYAKSKYTLLNNEVYAMSIPLPPFRDKITEGISIELLYTDEDLRKEDMNGRRIFLSTEFNDNGRLESDKRIGVRDIRAVKSYLEESKTKIIAADVFDIDGKSLAMSKNQFARYILDKQEPFDQVNLEGFRQVFNIIQEILEKS